jgi:hypothetical protein
LFGRIQDGLPPMVRGRAHSLQAGQHEWNNHQLRLLLEEVESRHGLEWGTVSAGSLSLTARRRAAILAILSAYGAWVNNNGRSRYGSFPEWVRSPERVVLKLDGTYEPGSGKPVGVLFEVVSPDGQQRSSFGYRANTSYVVPSAPKK